MPATNSRTSRRAVLGGGVAAAASGFAVLAGGPSGAAVAANGTLPVVAGPPPSGGDDFAALAAAMPPHGVLQLCPGDYQISGNLSVPLFVTLQGAGGSAGGPTTMLTCTSSSAGVTVSGPGGVCSGFGVDGKNIAAAPFLRAGGPGPWVGRTFIDLNIANAAVDNIVCLGAQNDAWYQVVSSGAGRDSLVCDQGYGGALFSRCEIAFGSRYNLRLDKQIPGGPYAQPADLVFHQCIVEYTGPASVSVAYLNGAINVKFDHTSFYASSATSGPLVDVTGGALEVNPQDASILSASGTVRSSGIRVGGDCQVLLTGVTHFQNLTSAIYLRNGTPQVDVKGLPLYYSCANRYGGDDGMNPQSWIGNTQTEPTVSRCTAPTDFARINAASAGAVRVNTDTRRLEASDGNSWFAPTAHKLSVTSTPHVTVPDGVTTDRARTARRQRRRR